MRRNIMQMTYVSSCRTGDTWDGSGFSPAPSLICKWTKNSRGRLAPPISVTLDPAAEICKMPLQSVESGAKRAIIDGNVALLSRCQNSLVAPIYIISIRAHFPNLEFYVNFVILTRFYPFFFTRALYGKFSRFISSSLIGVWRVFRG